MVVGQNIVWVDSILYVYLLSSSAQRRSGQYSHNWSVFAYYPFYIMYPQCIIYIYGINRLKSIDVNWAGVGTYAVEVVSSFGNTALNHL